jgi:hypothetical protein
MRLSATQLQELSDEGLLIELQMGNYDALGK